jgi:disease resistance protein RPM1
MANLVMGAMGSLIPKLHELLKEEYKLQTGMKKRISSLTEELGCAQAALRKVEKVPWDQLDEQVQIWARHVREAVYDMEDVLDTFLVRVQSPDSTEPKRLLQRLGNKMTNLFTKSIERRKISVNARDIMSHLQEVAEQCRKYKVDNIALADTAAAVDPRLHALYNKVEDLVGIEKSSGELISMLRSPQQDGLPNLKIKIVVIAGVGGLGKTTLSKAVYDNLQGDFDCAAFVTVGRNPNLHQVIQGILIELDNIRYMNFNFAACHQINQFINELQNFLHGKR